MRFHRLDFIKYGKFTDCSVDFPATKQDFHLIVGPNEAGKSTMRSAIVDLLFGIPHRSTLGFLHPLNELRLGAYISNKSDSLEFHRTKAQKQSLRSPQNILLADTVLSPFLGGADRNFFDQMFGLDHSRLVEGGNSILNAENDVGQVLFQAAAGVGSLGKVRDALIAEADKLWAPRKSVDRAYYIAVQQFEKANATLRQVTVRTKEWAEANRLVETLQEKIDSEREHHHQLQAERNRLERVRRLAPFLRIFRENEKQLNALGEVVDLPSNAATIFSTAEQELAKASQLLLIRNEVVKKTECDLGEIQVNAAVLEIAADIKKLEELRLQYGAYERDIERREAEKSALWRDVCNACTQLGWQSESEETVAKQLPTLLVRRELGQLARNLSGLTKGLRAAEHSERTKLSDIESLTNQRAELQSGEVTHALRAALENVKLLGNPGTAVQKQQGVLAKMRSVLEISLRDLGQWSMSLADLRAIRPPSQKTISRAFQDRQALIADQKAVTAQRDNLKVEIAQAELKISQFKELHHLSTREAVGEARSERNVAWSAIKKGEVSLQQGSEKFETTMFHADEVADIQLNNVEKTTELQGLLHQLERERQKLSTIENQQSNLNKEIGQLDAQWNELMVELGLTGMLLEDIGDWLAKKEIALAAGISYQEAEDNFRLLSVTVSELEVDLTKELREMGLQVAESDSLLALSMRAESLLKSIDDAKIRRETLSAQLHTAQTLLPDLQQATEIAKAEVHSWTQAWSKALEKAALSANSDVGTVEGSLELIGGVEEKLKKMREIQVDRIDAMRTDLSKFAIEADRLALTAAPEIKGESAAQIAQLLIKRLAAASEAAAEFARLKKIWRDASAQAAQAEESIQTAKASLNPLMNRAGVNSNALLAEAIVRSDECRRLHANFVEAKINLLEDGDGLTLEQIEKEVDATDLAQLAVAFEQIEDQLSDAVKQQTTLSAEHANSSRTLSEIGGSDAAAKAEALRQQAIAQMSDVAERYVKVLTAGHLLRWSIERYREEKQGPLLSRAGALFSKFTLGSFHRLVVDFEREPMVLEGLRSNGKLVSISGMSDGTRDQLYLALRLAALELHLGQAMPLPFIADDLFINYDEARSEAGFEALQTLSEQTQVIFLTHHDHLIPSVQQVFGDKANVVFL